MGTSLAFYIVFLVLAMGLPVMMLAAEGVQIPSGAAALAAPRLESLPDRYARDQEGGERIQPPPAKQGVANETEEDGPGQVGAEQVLSALAVGRR